METPSEPRIAAAAGEDLLARLATGTPARPVPLGRYDVIGCLGQGGMGTVYEGVDRARGTRVALKTLSVVDAAASVLLKREFRVVADVAHPNLAAVYELACEDGLWFFAMERVDGVSFMRWARGAGTEDGATATATMPVTRTALGVAGGPNAPTVDGWEGRLTLPPPLPDDDAKHAAEGSPPARSTAQLREALGELVRGLSALHDAGLRHGDIKSTNVLVRADGRVVVVDFGLAQSVGEARAASAPIGGTPAYMSPEQLAGREAGPASDWYAVGTMLYALLTGRLPFAGGSLLDLFFKKTHHVPPAPCELLPEVDPALSALSMALLRPEPERRPTGPELLRFFGGDDEARRAGGERTTRVPFVGRQRELERLEYAYGVARAGRRIVVHASGPSGIGKSALMHSFLRGVRDVDRAEVLRGRCYERESVPYKAFDGIVDELAERLRRLPPAAVEALLPEWVGELAQAFPALVAVPEIAARARGAALAIDAIELRRRAWNALEALLVAFAGARTLVLCIDDLHWADADSARLCEALVHGTRHRRMLFIAAFRPAEAADNRALDGYFALCERLRRKDELWDVPIAALAPAEAEQLARSTLAEKSGPASEGRVKQLAREAGGVPFFIEELSRYAAARGPLAFAGEVTLDDAIAARVQALPEAERALVEIVAVAGNPVPQSLVFQAAGLDAGALSSLLALRSASMLSWTGAGADDLVSTYHDRIRESVVGSLDEAARQGRHLMLGRALAERHASASSGPWVFDAVRHLGAAAALVVDPAERLAVARLHLQAGRQARRAAAFPLAFRCFEAGVGWLAPDAWAHQYELALGLSAGAAETAYLSAEWAALGARVAEVKARARGVMDQLVVWEVEIDACIGRHEYLAAVDTAMRALALFGVELPRDPGAAEIGAAFQAALAALTQIGPAGLSALPDVADPEVAAAMRIQVRVSPACYFGKPALLPIIACNLVTTSVERGLTYATPYALALFGIVLNTAGMFPVSHAWGELAVRLLDRFADRSLEAATRHVVYNLVCPWMVPLRTILEPLRAVFDIGRRTGDLEYAAYAAHGYVHNAMYAGRPLGPLLVEALELGDQMRALGQVNAVHVHEPFEQLLKCLTGKKADPACLDDAGFDEAALLAAAQAEGSKSGIYVLRVAMGLARYHFGRARAASDSFESARSYLDAAPSVWHIPIMHQFAALAACAAWEELDAAERAALSPRIDESLAALRALAAHAPVNFAHRVSLVEAELCRIAGDDGGARAKLAQVIAQASEAEWVSDIALAHELAARCQGTRDGAERELATARDGYAAWGAAGKAREIERRMAEEVVRGGG